MNQRIKSISFKRDYIRFYFIKEISFEWMRNEVEGTNVVVEIEAGTVISGFTETFFCALLHSKTDKRTRIHARSRNRVESRLTEVDELFDIFFCNRTIEIHINW